MRQRRPVPGVPERQREGKWGISGEEIAVLVRTYEGRCPICQREVAPDGWVLDHDHELAATHQHSDRQGCRRCVRGLICGACNTMLGMARDSVEVLRRGEAYLLDWQRRMSA